MRRRGVTRIEVAVVLGTASLVVGLLLSAIGKVRAKANESTCRNNLKQHALALENYESNLDTFPAACTPPVGGPPERRLSWCVQKLMYMESGPFYRAFNLSLSPVENAAAVRSFSWDSCPSHNTGVEITQQYIGVAGDGPDAPTLPADHPRAGMFAYDRGTKKSDVRDGLANTMLLVEIRNPLGNWATGGPATVRPADRGDLFPGPHNWSAGAFASSNADALAAMADGAVRNIRSTISPTVLAASATIAGGEKPQEPE